MYILFPIGNLFLLLPKSEVGAQAEVDAEGDGERVKVVTVGTIQRELSTEPIGGGEAMGIVDGGVGRVHTAEGEVVVADGECAEVGLTVEIGVTARYGDIADLGG